MDGRFKMTDEEFAKYCDNTDFGDEMEAARELGELYTVGELGCDNVWEAIKKIDELERRNIARKPALSRVG